jgi:hypothetical protein
MNSLVKIALIAAVFTACKNQPAPNPAAPTAPDASTILKHKYWVSLPFNEALFASNITDTLSYLPCSELVFGSKDTLLLTACLSDAGMGIFKVAGPNTLEISFEGFEGKSSTARYDETTGVLHLDPPAGVDSGWPTAFIAQDGIDVTNIDNITINLGRKRLAGNYMILPKKGEMAVTSILELHADGTHLGFGDFDTYEPWPSGIGGAFIQNPQRNLMYLVKKGAETDPAAAAWQVRGDTLRIWETKNIGAEGDLPEYKVAKLRGTYLKVK